MTDGRFSIRAARNLPDRNRPTPAITESTRLFAPAPSPAPPSCASTHTLAAVSEHPTGGDLLASEGRWKDALTKYEEGLLYAPNWEALKTGRKLAAKKA